MSAAKGTPQAVVGATPYALAGRKKEKGKQQTGIVIHSWKQSNQQKPLVNFESAQVVNIQSAQTDGSSQVEDWGDEEYLAGQQRQPFPESRTPP